MTIRYASHAEIVAWYRGDRPRALRGLGDWYNEGWAIREKQREQKQAVREGVKAYSSLRGPFGSDHLEEWAKQCSYQRLFLKGTTCPAERAKIIRTHRRTINLMRDLRFLNSRRVAGVSAHPFYLEPNCNFIPYEDVVIAEREGIVFTRVTQYLSQRDYNRLHRRFRVPGRVMGYWSSVDNVRDEDFDRDNRDQLLECVFLFTNEDDIDKLAEELIWLKMRH